MNLHRSLFQFWLFYVAGMVCGGWALSGLGVYRWCGVLAVVLLVVGGRRFLLAWRGASPADRAGLAGDLLFPPFLILLAGIALAGLLYFPTSLDSLSYRIPRMLMWLQEGGLHYINGPDQRMNYMPPVWEFASTPFYQAAGLRLLWLGNAICWIMIYMVFACLGRSWVGSAAQARWLAMVPASAVGFVLQAASTMNDIWAAGFLAISLVFIVEFEARRGFSSIVLSGLALALAANAKAHYLVLALPWLMWFFLSAGRPLRVVRWRWVLPLAMLGLVCSPLPTFIMNYGHYGDFLGPAGNKDGFGLGGPLQNMGLGTVMMIWWLFQPPVNPFAGKITEWNESWISASGLRETAPRFALEARELMIVESASVGLLVAGIMVVGLLLVIRCRKNLSGYRWALWVACAGVVGYLIAISQVVPGTLGRSFIGFSVAMFPIALMGLSRLRFNWLRLGVMACLLGAIMSLVFSPSHPLWPARTVIRSRPAWKQKMARYLDFQERAVAGRSLMDKLPERVGEIGVFAGNDQNLVHFWEAGRNGRRVRFFPNDVTMNVLESDAPEYLVFIGMAVADYGNGYPTLEKLVRSSARFERIASEKWVTKYQRGPEEWSLYRRLSDSH